MYEDEKNKDRKEPNIKDISNQFISAIQHFSTLSLNGNFNLYSVRNNARVYYESQNL